MLPPSASFCLRSGTVFLDLDWKSAVLRSLRGTRPNGPYGRSGGRAEWIQYVDTETSKIAFISGRDDEPVNAGGRSDHAAFDQLV